LPNLDSITWGAIRNLTPDSPDESNVW
jgi:hypothetical protein